MLESINDNLQPETGTCHLNRSAANAGQVRSPSVLLPPRQSTELAETRVAAGNLRYCVDTSSPKHDWPIFTMLSLGFHLIQLPSHKMLWEWRGLGTSQESFASHRRELLSLGEAFYKSKITACISVAI